MDAYDEGYKCGREDRRDDDATRIADLEAELIEAARLAGKGSEREAALLGKVTRLESRVATLEAELTRCRTTETASAHALDTLRQHFGLDLIRGEHPADTARRIAREDDRQTNGAIRIADEAIDGTASALEAEVLELRRALALAKPCVDRAANRIEQGHARVAAPILTVKAMIDRLLNKDDHDDRETK